MEREDIELMITTDRTFISEKFTGWVYLKKWQVGFNSLMMPFYILLILKLPQYQFKVAVSLTLVIANLLCFQCTLCSCRPYCVKYLYWLNYWHSGDPQVLKNYCQKYKVKTGKTGNKLKRRESWRPLHGEMKE